MRSAEPGRGRRKLALSGRSPAPGAGNRPPKVGGMDRATAQRWLDDYVSAWRSYDRDDIGALFAEDVAYRFHPYDEPLLGREAVVDAWLGESNAAGASASRSRSVALRYSVTREVMVSLTLAGPRSM